MSTTMEQTVSELAPLLTQIVNEIKENSLSISEVSNLFAQYVQEKKMNSTNNSEITALLTQIVNGINQNNLSSSEVSNLFSQLIEEKKKTGVSNAEITAFLTQMMENKKKNTLTAPEVSTLWTQYMGDTLGICVYKYFLKIVEDKELQSILAFALQLSQNHITQITTYYKQANFQVPMGFTENDVNLNAPRLFTDELLAFYTEIMTIHGLNAYSLAITTSEREDLRSYFFECIATANELLNKIIKYRQSKGQFTNAPTIPSPEQVEFVGVTGIISSLFGNERPLNATEINNLFFNVKKTTLVKPLALAFSQVAKATEVRNFMLEVVQLSGMDIDSFLKELEQDFLKTPREWDNDVTNSTVSPFSDKLMMLHMAFLVNGALAYYGTGLASSMRPDLITKYNNAIVHANKAAKSLFAILLKNGWLEKQPQAIDRKALAQGE